MYNADWTEAAYGCAQKQNGTGQSPLLPSSFTHGDMVCAASNQGGSVHQQSWSELLENNWITYVSKI